MDQDRVYITLQRAENLLVGDVNGKSDPYVVVRSTDQTKNNSRIYKTKIIKKTLNPQWNETFEFKPKQETNVLLFEVFDWDLIGKDDSLGNAILTFNENHYVANQEHDFTLSLSTQGKLYLKLLYFRDSETIRKLNKEGLPTIGYQKFNHPRDLQQSFTVVLPKHFKLDLEQSNLTFGKVENLLFQVENNSTFEVFRKEKQESDLMRVLSEETQDFLNSMVNQSSKLTSKKLFFGTTSETCEKFEKAAIAHYEFTADYIRINYYIYIGLKNLSNRIFEIYEWTLRESGSFSTGITNEHQNILKRCATYSSIQ